MTHCHFAGFGERIAQMGMRAEALAARVEQGAQELADTVEHSSSAGWEAPCSAETWTVGVTAHHVASMYPIELELVQVLASGQPVAGVTWGMVDDINATHAREYPHPTK